MFINAPGRSRTCNLQIRSLMLYPVELRERIVGAKVRVFFEIWKDYVKKFIF